MTVPEHRACPRRRVRGVGPVAVAVVLVAGCGRPAVLDVERSEARIRERLAETYDVDVGVVTCPDEVEVEVGATFTSGVRASASGAWARARRATPARMRSRC